jgi:Flp pilus assembly pilin Flp
MRSPFVTPSWRTLIRNRRGQSLVEYALLLALLCVGLTAILAGMGTHVRNTFSHGNDSLASADGGTPVAGSGGNAGGGNGAGGNGNSGGNGNGGGNGNSGGGRP